jgi:hypothetical protein
MIENGSNNCYEANGKRERNWWTLNLFDNQNLIYPNAQEAIKAISRSTFDGGNIQMSRGSVDNFIKRCFKNVIDLKDLLTLNKLYYVVYDSQTYQPRKVYLQTEDEVFTYFTLERYPSLFCENPPIVA